MITRKCHFGTLTAELGAGGDQHRNKLSMQSLLCVQRFALFMWFLVERPTTHVAALTVQYANLLHRPK